MGLVRRIASSLWRSSPEKNWRRFCDRTHSSNRSLSSSSSLQAWCLSTGRVGSKTLAALGKLAEGVTSYHEPKPLLYGLGKHAYESSFKEDDPQVFYTALEACRGDLIGASRGTYLETSPQVTFLAPFVSIGMGSSRFIHVIRHPTDVIRSGMRRKWYLGHQNDRWRLRPSPNTHEASLWEGWCGFKKNAWLWVETNRWIAEFLSTVPDEISTIIRSEDLFAGDEATIRKFYSFIKADVPPMNRIRSVLGKKLNSQVSGQFPGRADWTTDQIDFLHSLGGSLIDDLGYKI